MGRKKKIKEVPASSEGIESAVLEPETPESVLKPLIDPLTVDFSSEAFNDMARKINEIISHINK